jgi:hypothetical protein
MATRMLPARRLIVLRLGPSATTPHAFRLWPPRWNRGANTAGTGTTALPRPRLTQTPSSGSSRGRATED